MVDVNLTSGPLTIVLANSGRKWIGEVAHVALLYEQLEQLGHRPWIVCRRGFALHEHATAHGWRCLPLNFAGRWRPWSDWHDICAWRDLVLRERIDLLHCHRGKDHWLGVMVARKTNRPIIRTRHVMTLVAHNSLNAWLYLKASAAVLSVSSAVQRGFGSWVPRLPHGIVVQSAIKIERFGPENRSEEWRRQQAAPEFHEPGAPEPLWFGLVGRFQRVKGQRVFMEAAAQVARQLPQAHFLLAGAGGNECIDRWKWIFADPRGFSERVLVLDLVDNLPEILASLDVGVIASLGSEGSSRIALEMMASGVPLVATEVGGIPEILKEAKSGKLVPPGDSAVLANAMLEWANAASMERVEAGQRGREYVVKEHNPEKWAEQIVNVYRIVQAESRKSGI